MYDHNEQKISEYIKDIFSQVYEIEDNTKTREEIDRDIGNLRTRSSPGPKGLNNSQYKEWRDEWKGSELHRFVACFCINIHMSRT